MLALCSTEHSCHETVSAQDKSITQCKPGRSLLAPAQGSWPQTPEPQTPEPLDTTYTSEDPTPCFLILLPCCLSCVKTDVC